MQIIEVSALAVRSAVIELGNRHTRLRFVLYPMVHVARASFYAEVTRRLRHADLIVAEGIGRRPSGGRSALVYALTLSYRVLPANPRLGLVRQQIDYAALGVPVVRPDVDADEFERAWQRIPLWDRLMVGLYLPMVILERLVGGESSVWTRLHEVNDLPSPEDEEMADALPELMDALLGDRDRRLVAALERIYDERGSEPIEVAVVYGAGHIPAVVQGLRNSRGLRPKGAAWLTVTELGEWTQS